MIGVFKKCFRLALSIIFFMVMIMFIQTPVISTLSKDHVNFKQDTQGDILRVMTCIGAIILSLYFLRLLAKCLGINLSKPQSKRRLFNDKRLLAYIVVILLITLIYLILLFIGNGYSVGVVPKEISEMSNKPVIFTLYMFTTIISQPILEELLFRGILQERLARYSSWLSIIITSIVFSYIHGYGAIINSQFISSIIYGIIYKSSDDVRFPIIIHSLQNLVVVLFVIVFA